MKLSFLEASPSGHFIGRYGNKNQIGGDYSIAIWSQNGELKITIDSPRLVHGISSSSNGKYFAYALHNGTVEIREAATGNAYRTLQKVGGALPCQQFPYYGAMMIDILFPLD